jgi:glycosyltransferase involved in cell wall biosynthesis
MFLLRFFDAYLLFQDSAVKILKIKKPYLVTKPGVTYSDTKIKKPTSDFIMTYAGTLKNVNGIKVLLDAFELVETKEIKLYIYGGGTLESVVSKRANINKRIIYKGIVDDNELNKVYSNSDLLINLRDPDDYVMKFAFPSKLFEYMNTGVPVLTTRLLKDDSFVASTYVVDDLTPRGVAKAIKHAYLNKITSFEKGKLAKQYVNDNYSFDLISMKIYDFIVKLGGENV